MKATAATGPGAMTTFLKIALLGGGAYVLMRHTGIKLPFFGSDAPAPPADTTAPPAPPATAPPPGNPPANAPAVTDAIIKRAAGGDAQSVQLADAAGVKFNADQWNWYREQDTGQVTTADLFPPDNRAALMTASEYLQRRVTAGLGEIVYGRRNGWA